MSVRAKIGALRRRVTGSGDAASPLQDSVFGRGIRLADDWQASAPAALASAAVEPNPLKAYFEANTTGPGLWKWTHYFDIYHRYFDRFRGKPVNVVEVGIFSGGSLGMWRHYFGPLCHVYGVDIEPACKAYEGEGVSVFIGDQGDRDFWRRFRKEVPNVDIVIDDASHVAEHQCITMEELLPHLKPGGVYFCEDVHGTNNAFAGLAAGLAYRLHGLTMDSSADILRSPAVPVQRDIHSVHFHPFVIAVEKNATALDVLEAHKRGTEWQPFLDPHGFTKR